MKLLILAFIALAPLSGCVVGYGRHEDTSFFYGRLGDQKLIIKDGEISQSSEGSVPSGFFGLLSELIR